jgi:hypothetical protein
MSRAKKVLMFVSMKNRPLPAHVADAEQAFVQSMAKLVAKGMRLDNVVLNAGILKYPNVCVLPERLQLPY